MFDNALNILKNILTHIRIMNYFNKKFLQYFSLYCLRLFTLNNNVFAVEVSYVEWANNFGDAYDDAFYSVIETTDRGLVVVGYTKSINIEGLTPLSTASYTDAIIVKYDSLGKQVWIKNFGGTNNDRFQYVVETKDKGLVVVGYSNSIDINDLPALSTTTSYADAIIVKYDKDGNQLWARNFGGSKNDYFRSVVETSDGGLVAVGNSNSTNINDLKNSNGSDNTILIKYNSVGNKLWVKTFSGSMNDYFWGITETDDLGLVAVGYSMSLDIPSLTPLSTSAYRDAIIVKFDSDGNEVWANNFGGSYDDAFVSVVETSDKGFVTVGYVKSDDIPGLTALSTTSYWDGIIVKYDKDGKQVWANNFGGSGDDCFKSLIEVSDKGLVVVGYSKSTNISGLAALSTISYYDAIMVKYDYNGNMEWVRNFGGTSHDYFYSISKTTDGELIVVGESNSTDIRNIDGNLGGYDGIIVEFEGVEKVSVKTSNSNPTLQNIINARALVNSMAESIKKDELQEQLNSLCAIEMELTPLTATANIDMYVKFKNTLSLSLSTSSITFDDFSGVEDIAIENAVSLTVSSSLNYNISTSLVGNIVSSKGNIMDKSIVNLRANGDTDYKNYATSNTLTLFNNQTAESNKVHKIDIMLKGGITHTTDVYKAVLKFEVVQV